MHAERTQTPAPVEGMRIVDPAWPFRTWVVAQYTGPGHSIYIRREDDGHLFHHDVSSWAYAWRKGYLRHA